LGIVRHLGILAVAVVLVMGVAPTAAGTSPDTSLRQAWAIHTSSSISSTPVISGGNVYFADWAGTVYAATAATGAVIWTASLGVPISSSLAVTNGIVYVAGSPVNTTDNGPTEVWALGQSDGHLIWNTVLHSQDDAIWATPVISNGLLYIGIASSGGNQELDTALKGEFDALNANTGAIVWKFETSIGDTGGAGVWGTATVDTATNSVFFGTGNAFGLGTNSLYSYSVISLDATTGALKWYNQIFNSLQVGADNDFASAANLFTAKIGGVTHQAVGLGMKNGKYYVFDEVTGALLETIKVGNPPDGIRGLAAQATLAGGVPAIYVSSGYHVKTRCCGVVSEVLPDTKATGWNFHTPGYMTGSVALAAQYVVFGDENGNLYAIQASNGAMVYHVKLTYSIVAGPAYSGGLIIVGNFDYGLGSSNSLGLYAYVL
jgi:outer membrane protein assembly factor BamB